MDNIQYKYREPELIKELQEYVDTTYISEDNAHYAEGEIECTEYNIDQGHGDGFIAGNINKYNNRYGKKDGRNRKDLMKVLHYALMRVFLHDEEVNETNKEESPRESLGFKYPEGDESIRGRESYFKKRSVPAFKHNV